MQSELTDAVVTDISLPRLPPVGPYEYLVNAELSAVMHPPQTTIACHAGPKNTGRV